MPNIVSNDAIMSQIRIWVKLQDPKECSTSKTFLEPMRKHVTWRILKREKDVLGKTEWKDGGNFQTQGHDKRT